MRRCLWEPRSREALGGRRPQHPGWESRKRFKEDSTCVMGEGVPGAYVTLTWTHR